MHPDQPWPKAALDRVWDYVRRGGVAVLVAEPAIREGEFASSFNDVLRPAGHAGPFRYGRHADRQLGAVLRGASHHPATAGWTTCGTGSASQLGSSIRTRWPARPVLVGRWGWSDPGSDAVTTGGS